MPPMRDPGRPCICAFFFFFISCFGATPGDAQKLPKLCTQLQPNVFSEGLTGGPSRISQGNHRLKWHQ